MNLPVQLGSCMTMEALSRQGEDWYNLLKVQGCYSNAWCALNLAISSYRSSPAKLKTEMANDVSDVTGRVQCLG